MDEKIICRNIKRLRTQNHLTLEELARRTGLTKGYLSRVERSKKAPPYSTLNKIAGALGTEVTRFLEGEVPPHGDVPADFQKKGTRPLIRATSRELGYDYEVLAPNKPGKNMEPFIIYPPFDLKKMYTHEGEEFVYVIDGCIDFTYGDEKYTMTPGDSIYFDACVPHGGISLGTKKARLMVMIYFYKRNRAWDNYSPILFADADIQAQDLLFACPVSLGSAQFTCLYLWIE